MKKTISILLCLVLALSLCVSVFASGEASGETAAEEPAEENEALGETTEPVAEDEIFVTSEEEAEEPAEEPATDGSSDAVDIRSGDKLEVYVDAGEEATVRFTPSVSGWYSFYSESDEDTYVRLCDGNRRIAEDDDSGEDFNFLIRYEMTAGREYSFRVSFLSKDKAGSIPVTLVSGHLGLSAYNSETGERRSEVYVPLGESATLSVTARAEDMTGITYRWYVVGDGPDSEIEGEDGATLTTGPITEYMMYRCCVTDRFGNEANVYFYVHVDSGLTARAVGWDGNWSETLVEPGGSAKLEVEAETKLGTLSYEWHESVRDETHEYWAWNDEVAGTGPSLTVSGVENERRFICVVSDGYNNISVEFSVKPDSGLTARAVGWDDGWSETLVEPGGSAKLEVEAETKLGTLSYEWHEIVWDETYEYWDWNDEVVGTGPSLTVSHVEEKRHFVCVVKDGYNEVYVDFEIGIENHFTLVPVDSDYLTVSYGEDVELGVKASADKGGFTYQWYRTGEDYDEERGFTYRYYDDSLKIPDATTAKLALTNVTEAAGYACRATDIYGTERSVWFTVEIDTGLRAYVKGTEDMEKDVYVPYNGGETLSVTASGGIGAITYQWFTWDDTEYEWAPIDGANGAALRASGITYYTSYCCEVTDESGFTQEVYFWVYVEDGFTLEPNGSYTLRQERFYDWGEEEYDVYNLTVEPGGSATLAVTAHSDSGKPVTFEWYGRVEGLDYEGLDETSDTLTLTNVRRSGTYIAYAENAYGQVRWVRFRVNVSGGAAPERGDVDGRGQIDGYDAALVLRYAVGAPLDKDEQDRADMDGSGTVNAADAAAILSALNKK